MPETVFDPEGRYVGPADEAGPDGVNAETQRIGEAGAESALGTITDALVAAEWDIADEPKREIYDDKLDAVSIEAVAGSARIRISVEVLD